MVPTQCLVHLPCHTGLIRDVARARASAFLVTIAVARQVRGRRCLHGRQSPDCAGLVHIAHCVHVVRDEFAHVSCFFRCIVKLCDFRVTIHSLLAHWRGVHAV